MEPVVSVGVLSAKKVKFEFNGNYIETNIKNSYKGILNADIEDDKIVLKKDSEIVFKAAEFEFTPEEKGKSDFTLFDVIIGIDFHWEKKENQKFVGSLKLVIENGNIRAINILPVEDYITSVISSEMSATSSDELLKAHAIISRSWLLAQIEKKKEIDTKNIDYNATIKSEDELIKWYDREDHTLFDVCADDHCQRYQGITKQFETKCQEAVEKTYGQVLVSDDTICDARFSKCCGGISENFENVWEDVKHSYLQRVVDHKSEPENYDLDLINEDAAKKWIKGNPEAFCNTSDNEILSQVLLDFDQTTTDFYRWQIEYSQSEIRDLLEKKLGFDFGDIVDFVPVERGVSGRLIKLKIIGKNKTLTIGKELEIRRALSDSHLYSSAIVIEKENVLKDVPEKFKIYGAGWGHGVGLCQIGAAVMGENGYSYDQILMHYFKTALITKLY